ncbi:MAG: BT_3928 family protein, partial [Bacteroidota bacterium]
KITLITHAVRIGTGGLFIFSGTIKANDPSGFKYKLQEYFEVFKADFASMLGITDPENSGNFLIKSCEFFHDYSLPLAIIICVSEVALGFMLLIGVKKMLTLWLLLAQIIFFTFLTFYSACYNKVTGCGCFGDFIKLAPWESFWKDIILLVAIAILFAGKENINPLFGSQKYNWGLTSAGIVASVFFPLFCYNFLPVWDFLPFYNGSDVCKGRENGPKYKPAVFQYNMFYKNLKTGELKEFTDKNAPWADSLNWKYESLNTKLISKAEDEAKITTYTFQDADGNELADSLLNYKGYYFLLIMNKLGETEKNKTLINSMKDFYQASSKSGIRFYAVTHDFKEDIDKYKNETGANFPFLISDDVQLKMMVRSNPGLMLFKGCQMIKKWHYNSFPDFIKVKAELLK